MRKKEVCKKLMLEHELGGIPGFDVFAKIEPITKGLSGDKKYCVTKTDGERLFLRVSDISEYDKKKADYENIERVSNHGICTSRPVAFGLCNGGKSVYQLSEWLDGESADVALTKMSSAEQYALGMMRTILLLKRVWKKAI